MHISIACIIFPDCPSSQLVLKTITTVLNEQSGGLISIAAEFLAHIKFVLGN
jgi:hypothetical protein